MARAAQEQSGEEVPERTFRAARHGWADLARKAGRDPHAIRDAMKRSSSSVTEIRLASGEGERVDAAIGA